MDRILLHFMTPYSASCLVRGMDGRPKSMQWGGVDRARISSASMKRAIRTSDTFAAEVAGHIGTRTTRLGEMIVDRITTEPGKQRDAAFAAARILFAGGKADKVAAKKAKAGKNAEGEADEGAENAKPPGAALGKVKDERTLRLEQLVFVSPQEVDAAAALVMRMMAGENVSNSEVEAVIGSKTAAVDIAMFGRMFAERTDIRMTAAVEVGHPFTVDKAQVEADFYTAVDDMKPAAEDLGASFMGEQGFSAGLFYGFASINMDLLVKNLGGNHSLANAAARAFIKSALTVSPSGKSASFGSRAKATWAMVERGNAGNRSLAGAFLRPVTGDDHHAEAVRRAEALARHMAAAYEEEWTSASMNVLAGTGSLAELLAIVGTKE